MAKAVKRTQELTLEQGLWNCRVDFRGVGSLDKNRYVVNLLLTKQFVEIFESSKVDFVIFSTIQDSTCFIFDRNIINVKSCIT